MMAIIAVLVALFLWVVGYGKMRAPAPRMTVSRSSPMLYAYAASSWSSFMAPVLLMPVFSLNDSIFATFPLKGFTLRHYGDMLVNTSMIAR